MVTSSFHSQLLSKSVFKSSVNKPEPFKVFKEYDKAAEMSDAIIISTEWDEFKSFDWNHIYDLMKKPAWIFDGRNLLDSIALEKLGFKIYSIGKSAS